MRIALAPINPTVGDIEGNAALIAAGIEKARAAGAELVVFPELCLSGYPPRDLLLMEGFVPACEGTAKKLGEGQTKGMTAIFGVPLPARDKSAPTVRGHANVANSLLVFRDNRFVDRYDKRLLPTYDVFDEDRYFEPGDRAVVVPLSKGVAGGLTICEDLWQGEDAGFASRYASAPDPVQELFPASVGPKPIILS